MSECVFCTVAEKNEPFHEIVWQDENFVAFLSAYPVKEGHVLVIPRVHADDLFDLDEETYLEMMRVSRDIAEKIKSIYSAVRVAVALEGMSVSHVHVHVIPVHEKSDISMHRTELGDPILMKQEAEKIRAVL